jgi:hypothetical protein
LYREEKITDYFIGKATRLTLVHLAQHVLNFLAREWGLVAATLGMPHGFINCSIVSGLVASLKLLENHFIHGLDDESSISSPTQDGSRPRQEQIPST